MIHKFIDSIFEMEKPIVKLVKQGLVFSMFVCIIAVIVFYFYNTLSLDYIYHEISFSLLRTGITFAISFFICGIATNTILNN